MISGMVMGGVSAGISSMSGNPMFCFVAGTTVLTTLGKKAIETIHVGDTIPCVDHITGESSEKRVVTTTVNKVNKLIELDINGEIIQCTETHPFQVKGKGWVDACNLTPGDIVYTKDWNTANVLFYWHKSGAHNVAVRWNGREFIGYNTFSGSDGPDRLGSSLKAFLTRNHYTGAILTSIS